MWRKLQSLWVCLLLCLGILFVIDFSFDMVENVSAGNTLYVNTTGSNGAYTSIQNAIGFANSGDTIFVYSGTYYENLNVNKKVNLTGESKDNTIIDGQNDWDVVWINADWVNISGFTVRNSGTGSNQLDRESGVDIHSNNVTISDMRITENGVGIQLYNSNGGNISNNRIYSNNRHGISLIYSHNSTIYSNSVYSNFWSGIYLYMSNYSIMKSNEVFSNERFGFEILTSSENNITENNAYANNWDGIYLSWTSSNHVFANNISGNFDGIWLSQSYGDYVYDNNLTDDGIYVGGSFLENWNTHEINTSNLVNGRPVYYWKDRNGGEIPQDAGQAIIANCTNITVQNQEYVSATVGVELGFCSNCTVTNLTITNMTYGIYIHTATGNFVNNNSMYYNIHGVYLSSNSRNNQITRNTIYNSSTDSIHAQSTTRDNLIFHNDIIDNKTSAYDSSDNGNQWDNGYPDGGNYWSNYSNGDGYCGPNQDIPGGDGIGDTPYIIDEDSQDRYPLLVPFENFTPPWRVHNIDKDTYHAKIQEGIDNATSGDTIEVGRGVYYENVVINKTVSLIGEFMNTTIIDGGQNGIVVNITADWVNISGFTVKNASSDSPDNVGIMIYGASNCSVSHSNSSDNFKGIYVLTSNQIYILDSFISGGYFGIETRSSSNITISDNAIFDSVFGIYSYNSSKNLFARNQVFSNRDCGIFLTLCSENELIDNRITKIGLFSSQYYGAVYLEYSNNNSIKGNNITSNRQYGIQLKESSRNKIENNSISSHEHYWGIYFTYLSVNNTIKGNNIWNNKRAIYIRMTSDNNTIIENNIFSNMDSGIYLWGPQGNIITGNTISNNYGSKYPHHTGGIVLDEAVNSNISSNTMIEDGIQIRGDLLEHWNSHIIDSQNTVNGKPLYYLKNQTGGNIPVDAGQIILANCTNVEVANYQIENTVVGILIGFSNGINITNNTLISNNAFGIYVYNSPRTNLSRNHVLESMFGIYLEDSPWANIRDNIASNNGLAVSWGTAIYIDNAYWSNVTGNIVSQNVNYGIFIDDASYSNISGNIVYLNGKDGVHIDRSESCIISENIFYKNNYNGLNVWSYCDYTRIFHNEFIHNGNQTWLGFDNSNIYWDDGYPSGGNYWSDYTGIDEYSGPSQNISGSDDIGDTYYNVRGAKAPRDYYPLMEPKDTTPPVIQLLSPANNSIVQTGTVLDFYIFDDLICLVNYSINSGSTNTLGEPFNISTSGWSDGVYTIQINAGDILGNSNSSWFQITVDQGDPIITLVSPGNNSFITNSEILDFSIVDITLTESNYSVNGGADISFANPFDISIFGWGDGNYTVTVNARDTFGNSKSSWYFFTVDSTAPHILLNSPLNNSVIPEDTILDFSIVDTNQVVVMFSVNGGNYNWIYEPYEVSTGGWTDGNYTISIYAQDQSANSNLSWFSFVVDSTEPAITLNTPQNNSLIQSGVELDFTCWDVNLLEVNYAVDGGALIPLLEPYNISTSGWADGNYIVQIEALDMAGNSNSSWYSFQIDSTLPQIILVAPGNNSMISEGTTINFGVVDVNLILVEYSLDSGTPVSFSDPFDISTSGWNDGDYIVTIGCGDKAGNWNSSWYSFTLDSTKPTIQLISPQDGSFISADTIFDFSVNDANLLHANYSINGGPDIQFFDPFDIFTLGWNDGDYTIQINAIDIAGNSHSSSYFFMFDSTKPKISLNSPENNSISQNGTQIDFDVTDSNLMYADYSINWGTNLVINEPFDISTAGWSDGNYTIQITAFDLAGNYNSSWFFFTLDSTKPSIILNAPQNNSFIGSTTTLDYAVEDDNLMQVNYTINGNTAIPFAQPFDISTVGWTDGRYLIQLNALDLAGNLNSSSYFFTLDSTEPVILLNFPENNSSIQIGTILDFAVLDENLIVAEYSINEGPDMSFQEPYDISTGNWQEGDYSIDIWAVDLSGNSHIISFTFILDSTPPLIGFDYFLNHSIMIAGGQIIINVSTQDTENVFYSMDEGEYRLLDPPYTLYTYDWTQGSHIVSIKALDTAGNEAVCWFEIRVDASSPYIICCTPAKNSVDIGNDTAIVITFSEPMNRTDTEEHLSVTPNVGFTCHWNQEGTVLTISFEKVLEEGTTYNIDIDSQIADINGNPMSSEFELSFTTEGQTTTSKLPPKPPSKDSPPYWIVILIVIIIALLIFVIPIVNENRKS